MSVRRSNGSTIQEILSHIHSPSDPYEKARIESCGGHVEVMKIQPVVPAVPRVFADSKCTRGGLAMSRSIGDQLIHRFGVISDPSVNEVCLSDYSECNIIILIGSDGLLGYMKKSDVLAFFQSDKKSDLASELTTACQNAQNYLLQLTNFKYADDTSGIAVRLHL